MQSRVHFSTTACKFCTLVAWRRLQFLDALDPFLGSGTGRSIFCYCSRRDNNIIFWRPKFLWFLWNQKISCTNPNWKWKFNKPVGQFFQGFFSTKFSGNKLFNHTKLVISLEEVSNWTIILFIFRVAKSSQGREVGDHHSIGGRHVANEALRRIFQGEWNHPKIF